MIIAKCQLHFLKLAKTCTVPAGLPSRASEELERPQLGAFDRARSSMDEDAFLAAAAQEAEGARDPGGGKRHRLKSFLKGEGSNMRRLLDPREHGKEGAGSREGPGNPAVSPCTAPMWTVSVQDAMLGVEEKCSCSQWLRSAYAY